MPHTALPSTHVARAEAFRALHSAGILLLPNAWDPPSARMIQAAGAKAVATTSGGVSWSRDIADGELDADTALDALARIVGATDLPVTADLERGYHEAVAGVADTVTRAIELGVAGINIEDSIGGVLVPEADQIELLVGVRDAVERAGVPVFVNARSDVFLFADPASDPELLLEQAMARGIAYAAAGADGLFVPGLTAEHSIEHLARAVPVPINVMAGPGPVDVARFAELGVRRISWGSQPAQSTYGWLRQQVTDLVRTGGGSGFAPGLDFAETNTTLRRQG